jgi:manganese efflux pump family protein
MYIMMGATFGFESATKDYHIIGDYGALALLGFFLALDNFRVSIGLGTLNIDATRQKHISLAFGICESVTPTLGFVIGHSLSSSLTPWVQYIGPLILGGYGAYVILVDRFEKKYMLIDRYWLVFVLPLSLSLDNMMAGIGLGIIGFQIVPYAIILGTISGLMSLTGLRLGHAIRKYLPFNTDLIGGIALIIISVALLAVPQ